MEHGQVEAAQDEAAQDDAAEEAGPPRRRRRRRVLVGVLVLALAGGLWLFTGGAPVGHFRSVQAAERFDAAYDQAMAELPRPDEVRDVRTSFGVVRAYHFEGRGPAGATPIVLLPGRSSASPVWADNMPSLLDVRDVWAIDLLGEPGRSVQQVPIGDAEDQATWLAEALAALPAEEVHLVGVSIGGWTAVNLATRRPASVASVTVLDPVFTFADLSLEAIVRSIPAALPWAPRSWRDAFGSWTAGGAPVEGEPVADMIEAGMQTFHMALPSPSRIPREALEQLDVPVLAIMAGESPMHDARAAAELARAALPHATVEVYDDASHAINGEYPERIADDVAAFLDGLG